MQGERYSLNKQVQNFESNLDLLRSGMKETDMYRFLGDAFVVMVLGSNDYINNYLLPALYPTSSLYDPQDYANLLLNQYARQTEVRIYPHGYSIYLNYVVIIIEVSYECVVSHD